MKKGALLTASILALLVTSMAMTTYAQSYTILVRDPYNPANGAKGLAMSGHWVGQIPITITSGSTSTQTIAYCKQPENVIVIGSSYPATLAATTDDSTWRAISYILTWYEPATNNAGAVNQAAMWHLLDPSYDPEPWMDVSVDNAGASLAGVANGKDVVRHDDHFNWISPITTNGATTKGSPGETVTFIAQLTDYTENPRSNVRIQFSVAIDGAQINPAYMSSLEAFTNSQGVVQIAIQVPDDTPLGSTITVQASTRSIWPQRYIDLTNPDRQDLIGIGSAFDLTLSTNIAILGHIMVLPESALGALSAMVSFAAAFIIYFGVKRSKSRKISQI